MTILLEIVSFNTFSRKNFEKTNIVELFIKISESFFLNHLIF